MLTHDDRYPSCSLNFPYGCSARFSPSLRATCFAWEEEGQCSVGMGKEGDIDSRYTEG